MSAIEMTPNSIHRLENCCVITFYVKNSLRLQLRYDTIDIFHIAINNIIKKDMDIVDIVTSFMVVLANMEKIANDWINLNHNNHLEYNNIQCPNDQDTVVQKIFPSEDVTEIYTRWQSCIINLIYYNLTKNDKTKECGYYISKRESDFTIHQLVLEQTEACFKCPLCKGGIDKESTTNIFQCKTCCQRYCSFECKEADGQMINHCCELRRKYQFLKDIVCAAYGSEIQYEEDFPYAKGTPIFFE